MNNIGFFTAVEYQTLNKTHRQKARETIDSYFYLGGKKATVIDPLLDQVELRDKPISKLEKVAKIISYAIFPIPLIMLLAKACARSHHHFEIHVPKPIVPQEPITPEPKPEPTPEPEPIPEIITPPQPTFEELLAKAQQADEGIRKEYALLKEKALAALQAKKFEEEPSDFILTPEHEKVLYKLACQFQNEVEGGNLLARGREHRVYSLDAVPEYVFKEESHPEQYLSMAEKARNIIQQHHLYLLHVPKTSSYITISHTTLVVEQREPLVSHQFGSLKGVFRALWNDPEMQEYMITLFSQLLIFIGEMQFSDVKYNNIPLTTEGKIALVDLDTEGCMKGFLKGDAREHGGLLHYIPAREFERFYTQAKEYVAEDKQKQFDEKAQIIRTRLEKRPEKSKRYAEYLQQQHIQYLQQPIHTEIPKLFEKDEHQWLAISILEMTNEQLQSASNYDLKAGRTVWLETYKVEKKANKNIPKGYIKGDRADYFKLVYETLQKNGIIFKGKIPNSFANHVIITC